MTDNTYLYGPGDRGVSEAIGFMLIFTMVIVGIGLVTLYGYPMLIQQQVTADEKIMEKNMIVLQNDEKSLTYKTIPFKETSLKIGSGTLEVHNQSDNIAKFEVYDRTGYNYITFHPGDLRYVSDSADTDLSLQNGAVVKRQHLEAGSLMLAEPRWFVDDSTNTVVINLIATNSSTMTSRAGIGTVQTELGQANYSYNIIPVTALPLMVKYTPDPNQDYSAAWGDYFIGSLPMTSTGTPGEYKFNNPSNQPIVLVIKTFEVIVKSV